MKFPFIDGKAKERPQRPVDVPTPDREHYLDPAGYLMDQALVDAVNVALLLSQPLLVTGAPGTGKTQLAYRVAWELGLGTPLRFDTKSTSTARDLFYTFDTLSRFHAANVKAGANHTNLDYITYNALGRAMLFSRDPEDMDIQSLLPPGFVHTGKKVRSVVLIDEVDKAPRDFPNDLLNEVENMMFCIPELGNAPVIADRSLRPIVVLTSNSEKNLPDAFLRRCVYFHIDFPSKDRLAEIVRIRVPEQAGTEGITPLLDSVLTLFFSIQGDLDLRKPPSTAELINWVQALQAWGVKPQQTLKDCPDVTKRTLSTLAKTKEDLENLDNYVKTYIEKV
ncbi:AAA family ATPase [Nitrospira sp. Nam80]